MATELQTRVATQASLSQTGPTRCWVIVPTNNELMAIEPEVAGPEGRRAVEHSTVLHAGRSALGAAAVLILLWALCW